VERWLAPLRAFLEDEGVGQIPEIFDGDAPHRPRGCIAQAWSVAELLRLRALSGACAAKLAGAHPGPPRI
jgi:glycogen debranching enzyme